MIATHQTFVRHNIDTRGEREGPNLNWLPTERSMPHRYGTDSVYIVLYHGAGGKNVIEGGLILKRAAAVWFPWCSSCSCKYKRSLATYLVPLSTSS